MSYLNSHTNFEEVENIWFTEIVANPLVQCQKYTDPPNFQTDSTPLEPK